MNRRQILVRNRDNPLVVPFIIDRPRSMASRERKRCQSGITSASEPTTYYFGKYPDPAASVGRCHDVYTHNRNPNAKQCYNRFRCSHSLQCPRDMGVCPPYTIHHFVYQRFHDGFPAAAEDDDVSPVLILLAVVLLFPGAGV